MRLLVSVINCDEAEEAIEGGADILDLKNPEEGSLGAAHPKLISELCYQFGHILPVSVAVGDFPHLPNSAALAALCAADMGADYIKIGLLGSHSEQQAINLLANISDALAWRSNKAKLVAAAYADYQKVGTLNPCLLPRVARQANFAGCMIDTLDKQGKCLFDFMHSDQVKTFIAECRRYGLMSALAGSLKPCHVDVLKMLEPDIVGVRGAVCRDGIRTGSIDRQRVAAFSLNLLGSNRTMAVREWAD